LKTGQVIYEKNANAQLPLASLTKLMTVLTAMDTLTPNESVEITHEALTPEGGGLNAGEVWRTEDLVDYTLIASVNDGAHALALAASEKNGEGEAGFIARMNAKAKAIGMVQTYFTNDTGLDISELAGSSYGSARDIAILFEYLAVHVPRLVEGSTSDSKTFIAETGQVHTALNTSSVIGALGGAIASKTGFTDLAGGNLGIVFEPIPGKPVSAVVLGSTREGRDTDMKVLIDAAKKWERRTILCTPE
jgi:D-alanyl-D-alanine carboxypeptidase (penicillin-binding protein 5/6)